MPHLILIVFGFVFFVLATTLWWGIPGEPGRIRLIAAGLACWIAAELVVSAGPLLR